MKLEEIAIRTQLQPGDIGYVVYLHGRRYKEEYQYGIGFETYVAEGLLAFQQQYDAAKDAIWICEYHDRIVGCLFLVNRGDAAQLRYFIVEPECRGIGLGNKLMRLFMDRLRNSGYRSAFLWTTNELPASAHLYRKAGFRLTEEKPSAAFGKELMEQRYDLDKVP